MPLNSRLLAKAGTSLTLLAALGALSATSAHAAGFTPIVVNGNFNRDDNVSFTSFSLSSAQTLDFYTTSYGGGTNADGTTTAAGGFDPILTLFNGTGNEIAGNDDPANLTSHFGPAVNTDPTTASAYDSSFSETLGPGQYFLAVSEYNNFAGSKGFNSDASPNGSGGTLFNYAQAGRGNFTGPRFGTPGQSFIDANGDQRTANFTYNIAAAPVPEASTTVSLGLMLALGLGGMALTARRRKGSQNV